MMMILSTERGPARGFAFTLVPEKMQMCNGQILTILLALAGVWRLFSICML
jgi:hypothetical protein